jgi:hypothetical protein
MYKKNEVLPNMSTIGRSSWSAIFSGTVVALIINTMLGLLGLAIGLGSIGGSPTGGMLQNIGTGAIIWAAANAIISLFCGGWVAARFAGMQRSFDGALHGLVTWGLTSILMVTLLAGIVSAVVGGGLRAITGGGANAMAALPPQAKQQVMGQVQQGAGQLQAQANTPQERAQLQQQATQVGAQAAQISSRAAWGGFIILLLGGIAAAVGGATGRIRGPVRV